MCEHSHYFPFLVSFKVEAKPNQEIERLSTFWNRDELNIEMGIIEVNSTLKWEFLGIQWQLEHIMWPRAHSVWCVAHRQCYYSSFPPRLESDDLCITYK